MMRQLHRYLAKAVADGNAGAEQIALFARDDELLEYGAGDLLPLGREIIRRLDVVALMILRPKLPLADLLPLTLSGSERTIVPQDTETRTFLHDIPVVRQAEFSTSDPQRLIDLLGQRKGILVEGCGIIATGAMTVEQAYINCSSVFHALYVKCLLMPLREEPLADNAVRMFQPFCDQLSEQIPEQVADLMPGPFRRQEDALSAMIEAGRRTVELKLVDSFFGNISCRLENRLLISQTGASLDTLAGCVDPVPDDNSSTAGITASSELIAHRAIYQATGAAVILHGHPKLSVALSLLCEEKDCKISDCWKDCDKVRYLQDVPVVAGEVGAGGLARKVPPVMGGGIAVVYGHGVFATGRNDFREPLLAMIKLENWCREQYLRYFADRSKS